MVREEKKVWKARYFEKITKLLTSYPRCLLVSADNVGSLQMQQIRIALRGHAEVLFGKNTMMRKAIRAQLSQYPELERLIPYVVGNIGFVFTSEDLNDVRKILESNKKEAPAKAGALSPVDVYIPKGNTGMGPEKTSFFQALAISTKITKGTIEILNDIHIVKKDEKVGASEATLLGMLKVKPFHYGLVVVNVYDEGCVFSPSVLDIKSEDVLTKFMQGVANVAAVSLGVGYPTVVSVPHSIVAGFRNVAAVCLEADYDIPQIGAIKEFLADPTKFVAAVVAPTEDKGATAEEPAAAVSEEEESDDDMGFDLFD